MDWSISADEKRGFDQIFLSLDTSRTGYITRESFVKFLTRSRLGTDVVERIWQLADVDKNGTINQDEFAVIMAIAREQRTTSGGKGDISTLPDSLPANLIPPSMRYLSISDDTADRPSPPSRPTAEASPVRQIIGENSAKQASSSGNGTIDHQIEKFFPSTEDLTALPAFDETTLHQISDLLLAAGKEKWSRIPRTYVMCRITDQLDSMDAFVDAGCTDIWFPYSQDSLPHAIGDPEVRARFLALQGKVLSTGFDLEDEKSKEHVSFASCDDVPFRSLEELGQGGFGSVDRVKSTLSLKEYARKQISRKRTFKATKEVLEEFERELSMLQRVSHRHIITFIGSYTCPRYVGLIMSPVCETDLDKFLNRGPLALDRPRRSHLRTFYGCITAALRYLHDKQIRHKDIKPRNILVNASRIYLTDFGLSRDSSSTPGAGATTTGVPAALTQRYAAPEVGGWNPRSYSADVWSLGCVFLEMTTVLLGWSIRRDLDDGWLAVRGTGDRRFWANPDEGTRGWVGELRRRIREGEGGRDAEEEDLITLTWAEEMLRVERRERPSVRKLFEDIAEPEVPSTYLYCGRCCLEDAEGDSP